MMRFFDNSVDANGWAAAKALDGFAVKTKALHTGGYKLFIVEVEPDPEWTLLKELGDMLPARLDKCKRVIDPNGTDYDSVRHNRSIHEAIVVVENDLKERRRARAAVLRQEARLFDEVTE